MSNSMTGCFTCDPILILLTGKFDLTNVNNMAFYIYGPKLLFETTEISTHPNSTQQESNYIYLYTTKFGTSIKIRLNRIRDNESQLYIM